MRVSEVAARMEISYDSALRFIKNGTIPGGELAFKFESRRGARWRVRRTIFDEWFHERAANMAS
jgi:predicted site-specific integrase-resolvase